MVLQRLVYATACAACALSAPAFAQDRQADEILVTATKTAAGESPDNVALAIDAFSAKELEARQVRSLQDLTYAAPNVSLDDIATFRGTANFAIRGLGINSSIASVDPAVGTFVDGVYLGINGGVILDLADLSSIEVVRGPQGVQLGRNVTGGAVLINTADPVPTFSGLVRAFAESPIDGGRGDAMGGLQGVLNAPLGANGAAVRVSLSGSSDGGYFRNLKDGGDLGAADTWIGRVGLLVPLGGLKLTLKGEHLNTSGQGAVGQNHGLFARDSFDVSLDTPGRIAAKSDFGVARADYALGGGTITNVLGWRKYRQDTTNDIDSTPTFQFNSDTLTRQEQWSDELRWAGSLGALDALAGAYWFHQKVSYQENRKFPAGAPAYGGGRQTHEQVALFGQASAPLGSQLKAIAGLRWSRESKRADVTFVRTRAACSVVEGTCPVAGTNAVIPGEPNGFSDKRRWSNWSPRLALEFRPAAGQLLYGSWNRAWRSGGYNLRITQPAAFLANAAAAGSPAYGAERVDGYELGAKLNDGRAVSFNLALFRNDVRDMQREVSVASATSGLSQSIYNTADARVTGGEVEAHFRASADLTLSANAGAMQAKYRTAKYDISGDGKVDESDLLLKLPRAPQATYGAGFAWTPGRLALRADYQHRARYAYTDSNFGWIPRSDDLSASVAYTFGQGVTVSLYGKNLLDEVQFGGDTQLGFASGPLSDGNNRPFDPAPATGTFSPLAKGRRLGVELSAQF